MEVICADAERGHVRHALFDFDGTLSLIREGWQQIMRPMMVEWLRETPRHEDDAELERVVLEFVTRLTGKQTIYQMIQLAEEIAKRGGQPLAPLAYKQMYLERLWERIKDRRAALENRRVPPEEWLVPGARGILEGLRARGVRCYLASGSDLAGVHAEVEALQLHGYFAYVGGALDDYKKFSKQMVIAKIMAENHLSGREFVAFGDGFVEIEEAKRVNGLAVGVASNEATRTGCDEWKRVRLIEAGADVIVPDFREHEELAAYLTDKT